MKGNEMSGMWPAWVDTRSVFPMCAAGPIICPDLAGRGVFSPSDIQSDKTHNDAERAAARLEVEGSEQSAARAAGRMLPNNPSLMFRVA